MRIKKKQSLSKITEKQMSSTINDRFLPAREPLQLRQQKMMPRLPPIRRNIRTSTKIAELEPVRKETETTLSESSMMFQSMYGKEWLRPSDYAKEISELNLLGQEKTMGAKDFSIDLSQKFQKNIEKYGRMREVTEKWVQVLRKAVGYLKSSKAASDKLTEEIKFWKVLSRKFDQLEYEFNDERATNLLAVMRRFLRTEPQLGPLLEEFLSLKEQVTRLTPAVKKLYLQLQEVVAGFVSKLEQCSDICESVGLLRKILIGFEAIGQENQLLGSRRTVIYEKVDQCMRQKLLATSLYPRQLANISSVKDNYHTIDTALSFYSHFLASLEDQGPAQLISRSEYSRQVLADLLQILGYFQHLYHARQVNQFSKLFSHPLSFDIFDQEFTSQWSAYMQLVTASMQAHNFDP